MKKRLGLLPLAVLMSTAAFAADEDGRNLDGVIVTGVKEEAKVGVLGDKSLIDTPYSVTVITAEDIRARGAKSMRQVFINDPSFYTPASSNTTDWWGMTIRGMPVRNTYADDVPLMLYWGGDFPVDAADSVTVLKGATGFMYGFGSPGGTVVFNTKKPQAEPANSVGAEYRTNSVFSANFDHGGALSEDLRYRVSMAGEKGEAYNAAGVNRFLGTFALDQRLGEQFTWSGSAVYEYSKLKHEPFQIYLDEYDVVGSGGILPRVTYDYDDFNIDNSSYLGKTLILGTGLEYEIADGWSLKYQLGYTRKDHVSNKSFADVINRAGDYNGVIYSFNGRLENYFNQATLKGNFQTGPLEHDIVAGVGQMWGTSKYSAFYYGTVSTYRGNLFQEQTFRITNTPNMKRNPVGSKTTQTYGFISDTIKLGEHWQVIAGGRYTHYDKEDRDRNNAVASGYGTRVFTPTVALLYKPQANATVYVSYVESLEPGSVVGVRYANANETLNATVSTQYEAGFKYAAGRAAIEAAVFKISRSETMDTLRGGLLYLTQDGRSTFKGFEVSAQYRLTEDLKIGGGFVTLDASIDEVSVANAALRGNRPANAGKIQGVFNAEYSVPAIEGLSLRGVVRHYGDTYVSNLNNLKAPAYTVVNVGADYRFKLQGRPATLNLNVNNLLNKKYWAAGGYSAGNMGEAINGSVGLNVDF